MKKLKLMAGIALSVFALGATSTVNAESKLVLRGGDPVYRLYNKNTGEHFYTLNVPELISLQKAGWSPEGIGWYAPPISTTPVYRIYNPNAAGGDHYYTKNKAEAAYNVSLGWKWDNNGEPAFYSNDAEQGTPTYVAYNPNAKSGSHNYTTNINEQANLTNLGWMYGAVAWKALVDGTNEINLEQIADPGFTDLTTIQGLWKSSDGRMLEVINDQFLLDGFKLDKGEAKLGNGFVSFNLSDAAMAVINPGIADGPNDKSDLSKARIFIGQTNSLSNYFYKVGN